LLAPLCVHSSRAEQASDAKLTIRTDESPPGKRHLSQPRLQRTRNPPGKLEIRNHALTNPFAAFQQKFSRFFAAVAAA